MDYPGGFITKTAPTLNPALGNAAPGVWRLNDVLKNIKAGTWPGYDPYFDYTTLLLHGNGTNGGQNNTFLDSGTANSGSGFTITRNGNTTQGTFSPFSQTGWSNYFDGSGDYLQSTLTGQTFGTGDFTVEFWVKFDSIANTVLLDTRVSGDSSSTWAVQIYNNNLSWEGSGVANLSIPTSQLQLSTWMHFAYTRVSGVMRVYMNGVQYGSTASVTNNYTSTRLDIGGAVFASISWLSGYMSNVRLVKGSAVYTGNFTPPTAPLTAISGTVFLSCQSNRFVDNSSSAFSISVGGTPSVQAFSPFAPTAAYSASTVGGSGYFDGSGDYLTAPANAAWAFGTGDFTVECWVYSPVNQSNNAIVSNRAGSSNNNKWSLEFYGTNNQVDWHTGATVVMSSSTTAPINAWNHIAVSRSGTSLKMFINGAQVASVTDSYNYSEVNQLQIGYEPNYFGLSSILPLTGWVSGLRILKGTALYTTAFTPPAAPLTAIANTSFLANFTNAAIIDNTAKNVLETVGNAQISTTQSKFGGASLYFDGTGDYLLMPTTEAIKVGGGDFTIEFWLYWASSLTPSVYWASSTSSILITDSAATYAVICSSTDTASGYSKLIDAPSSLSANTWGHVAVVRSSGTTRIYLNGTVGGNTSSITGSFDCAWIGYQKNGGRALNGYIDDLRITKGIARYTSNFTPQTSQWQDQ